MDPFQQQDRFSPPPRPGQPSPYPPDAYATGPPESAFPQQPQPRFPQDHRASFIDNSQRPSSRQEPPRPTSMMDPLQRPGSRQDPRRPTSMLDPPARPSSRSVSPQRPASRGVGGGFPAGGDPRMSMSSYASEGVASDMGEEADLRRGFRAPTGYAPVQQAPIPGGDDFSTLRSNESGTTLNNNPLRPPFNGGEKSAPSKSKSPTILESAHALAAPPRRPRNPAKRRMYIAGIVLAVLLMLGGIGVAVLLLVGKQNADKLAASQSGSSGLGASSKTTSKRVAVPSTTTAAADSPTAAADPPPDMVGHTVGNVTFLPSGQLPTGPLPDSVIKSCSVPGLVAMTFDDGPFQYTSDLLDQLDRLGVKVTFFINGRNQGDLGNPVYANLVKRAHDAGHCIGSHTWSHADLTSLTAAGIRSELQQVETFMVNTFGKKPNFMRPPYGRFNDLTVQTVKEMGYAAAVLWDQDTYDWAHPQDTTSSVQIYRNALATTNNATSSILIIQHDVVPTVAQMVPRAIDSIWRAGWVTGTMEECLQRACYRDP